MNLYRRDQIQIAIREGREATVKAWAPFGSLLKFLGDYYPGELDRIRACSMRFEFDESREKPGYVKRRPIRCWRVPLCFLCSKAAHHGRVRRAQDQLAMVTPKGKNPRLYHVVQTAHVSEDETRGWGLKASEDLEAFGRVVWSSLRDWFGDGLGAIMSYQDFGERGFAKRHPHMDLTLNGYRIIDGNAIPVPQPDLTRGGFQRWCETVMGHATALDVTAYVNDVDFTGPVESHRAYNRILTYQMREMIDVRKIEYEPTARRIIWLSYKEGWRTPLPANVFVDKLDDYAQRLGQWVGQEGRVELHRRYGHLSKRAIQKASGQVGGEPIPHGEHCPGSCCGDWDRVILDAEEQFLNRGARIPIED